MRALLTLIFHRTPLKHEGGGPRACPAYANRHLKVASLDLFRERKLRRGLIRSNYSVEVIFDSPPT
ncbi:MAG: hypothetical protein KDD62_06175, partial [Bdellovibrionales bacterium]|nr:hypothetical protein [Bdellovibrionales bacterium]